MIPVQAHCNIRNISNLSYVFDGFEDEGSTDYTANGLNQYTLTEAAPPPPAGQSTPAPETVVATSYTYDANGSLTSTGRWNYAYDAENRLIQAHDTVDNVVVRYHYDGKGRRVAKHVDDNYSGSFVAQKRYEYLYEGDEPIQDLLKVSSAYVVQHRHLHGASVDERLVHWSYDQNGGYETAEQFYHRDHQGSIVAMSDASGDRATGELYTYDAYGNMGLGNTLGQPFRYTGRRWDDETGLYYYRARYYSAKLGRFLQTDPIGYEDNMNMYGYTANDPVNNIDPSGTDDCGLSIPGECGGGLPGEDSGDNDGPDLAATDALQDSLRARALNTPLNQSIELTADDITAITEDFIANILPLIMDLNGGPVSWSEKRDIYSGADTVLYIKGTEEDIAAMDKREFLQGRTYTVSGVPEVQGTTFSGGEINYIGVGVVAAHFGEVDKLRRNINVWNFLQYLGGQGRHNLRQVWWSGEFQQPALRWARFGAARYKGR